MNTSRALLFLTTAFLLVTGLIQQHFLVGRLAQPQTKSPLTSPPSSTEVPIPPTASPVAVQVMKPPMPYLYPVHKQIPPAKALRQGLATQAGKDPVTCAVHAVPSLPHTPVEGYERFTPMHVERGTLLKEFYVEGFGKEDGLFVRERGGELRKDAWWVPDEGNIPCTKEAQEGIWKTQHPDDCKSAMFLQTKLKEKAHGLGSALSLVVHDLITSVAVGRVLTVQSRKWFFASDSCGGDGWGCYFTAPSHCPVPQEHAVTVTKSSSKHKIIAKKTLDTKGMSRNDLPRLSKILSPQCVESVARWASDPANIYLMGTFEKGSDPLLTWWMAQTLRYLVRSPQPWFSKAVEINLHTMGFPWANGLVFEQLRGEIAKFREYYNVFGCHDVNTGAYMKWVKRMVEKHKKTEIYVSGNTPHANYTLLKSSHADLHTTIRSTWEHPAIAVSSESQRWGASTMVASWTDFWAGAASSGWVCIIQSNWCRMINFLRLTAGRAECPFIDLGMAMMIPEERGEHCVVRSDWPTKPFSSVLKKLT